MVGDTDLPKMRKTKAFSHEDSRTCFIENKGGFSAAPAPRIGDPPDPETKTPARAATVAGAEIEMSREARLTDYSLSGRHAIALHRVWTVSPDLIVVAFAAADRVLA